MEQGFLRRDDPLETAITVWAEVHGLVSLYRMQRFGQDVEVFMETYRHAVNRLLKALKA